MLVPLLLRDHLQEWHKQHPAPDCLVDSLERWLVVGRVAAILDKADAIRRKRRQTLADIDALLRATFLDMFGDPRTNARGWDVEPLEKLCEKIVDCPHTTPKHSSQPGRFPSIRTSDLQDGFIDLSTAKYVDEDEYKVRIKRHSPRPGDIIYSREGERLGIAAIVPKGMTPCLGQRTMLFRARSGKVTPEFLWRLLNSQAIYRTAVARIGGATSPHINIGDIRQFAAIRPPISLQREFSSLCSRIAAKRQHFLEHEALASDLFARLSADGFRGKL
jgi:type I restriction enzyme, S subunit